MILIHGSCFLLKINSSFRPLSCFTCVLVSQTEEFEEMAARMHQQIGGQSVAEAEFNFLQLAKQLEFYGVEQYPAQDQSGRPISLGVCAHGIVIFKGLERLKTYPW